MRLPLQSSRAQPVRRRGRPALRRPRVQIRPAMPHPVAEAVEGRSGPAHAAAVQRAEREAEIVRRTPGVKETALIAARNARSPRGNLQAGISSSATLHPADACYSPERRRTVARIGPSGVHSASTPPAPATARRPLPACAPAAEGVVAGSPSPSFTAMPRSGAVTI